MPFKCLIQNPHYFFYPFAILFLILSWGVAENATFDFNSYDTYFVLSQGHTFSGFGILMIFLGVFYQLISYKWEVLTPALVHWHILITLLGPVITCLLMLLVKEEGGAGDYDWDNIMFNEYIGVILKVLIPLSLFLIISLLPVNMLWSFWKAWRERTS